ncbi:MAG: class I SAM-dependent methyltransferase [Leptothrix sp. (in: b-proteobacteria)]
MASWLETPPGRYLLECEQNQLDRMVFDLFGFHAVQLGWPALQGLRTNRMPHRWMLSDTDSSVLAQNLTLPPPPMGMPAEPLPVSVLSEFEALPFPSQSLDLVLLPHTLELAADPHQTLREVERVLRPEGRVIVVGFNPASLWGLRRQFDLLTQNLSGSPGFLPHQGELISLLRLRDWLHLLGLQIEIGHFRCYRPALSSAPWLERTAWMERAGPRWWSVFGSVYFLVAVKRVRGMRLLGPAWKRRTRQGAATPALTQSRPHSSPP